MFALTLLKIKTFSSPRNRHRRKTCELSIASGRRIHFVVINWKTALKIFFAGNSRRENVDGNKSFLLEAKAQRAINGRSQLCSLLVWCICYLRHLKCSLRHRSNQLRSLRCKQVLVVLWFTWKSKRYFILNKFICKFTRKSYSRIDLVHKDCNWRALDKLDGNLFWPEPRQKRKPTERKSTIISLLCRRQQDKN